MYKELFCLFVWAYCTCMCMYVFVFVYINNKMTRLEWKIA